MKKTTAILLAILTFALIFTGCASDKEETKTETTTKAAAEDNTNKEEAFTFPDGITIYGEDDSKYSFVFKVTHKDGSKPQDKGIRTNKETLGEALIEASLIDGREESTGYVVYTVDGVRHDHNTEGFYWVLYINGELAEVDVMKTEIENGATYEFICERYMK